MRFSLLVLVVVFSAAASAQLSESDTPVPGGSSRGIHSSVPNGGGESANRRISSPRESQFAGMVILLNVGTGSYSGSYGGYGGGLSGGGMGRSVGVQSRELSQYFISRGARVVHQEITGITHVLNGVISVSVGKVSSEALGGGFDVPIPVKTGKWGSSSPWGFGNPRVRVGIGTRGGKVEHDVTVDLHLYPVSADRKSLEAPVWNVDGFTTTVGDPGGGLTVSGSVGTWGQSVGGGYSSQTSTSGERLVHAALQKALATATARPLADVYRQEPMMAAAFIDFRTFTDGSQEFAVTVGPSEGQRLFAGKTVKIVAAAGSEVGQATVVGRSAMGGRVVITCRYQPATPDRALQPGKKYAVELPRGG